MKRQKLQYDKLRSVAGFLLVGPGLFLLEAHVITVLSQFSRFLNQTGAAKLDLVSSVMLAASFTPHRLAGDLLTILYPVIWLRSEAAFLKDSPEQNADPCLGCA